MYLSKLSFQLNDPKIQKALRDCQEMHKLTTQCFATDRQSNNILYRVRIERGRNALYVYSDNPMNERLIPDCMSLEAQRDITEWVQNMQNDMMKRFDLLAMPTKKVKSNTGKNSQRRILRTPEERLAWMERKAEQFGFQFLEIQEIKHVRQVGQHGQKSSGRMYFDGYHYQGVIRITDATKFKNALHQGIGAGKAYGFGMLMLA